MTRKRFLVNTDEEFHRRVKAKAASEGRTISDVVLSLLDAWVRVQVPDAGAKRRQRGRRR